MRALITGLLLLFCSSASAKPMLACYQDRWTHATTCIDENAVTANGNTRAAPLYKGGSSNGIQQSPYLLVTNCAKGVSTLQASDGAKVAEDLVSSTPAVRLLAQWMCEVKTPTIDFTLRPYQDSAQGR
ncbi:MAG: hypothetical protein WCA09_01860 [Burkholderiales bacterium]